MLNTINGFDLILVIIIVIAGFKIYNLNRECESYVEQILRLSWDLQTEIQASKPKDTYGCVCNYCTDSDPWLSECQAFNRTDLSCQFTSQCACSDCVPF
jgi:hypothetical protein